MTISEKAAYLKGMMDGMALNTDSNEGKMIAAIVDLLGDMGKRITDIKDTTIAISDELDEIEEDLDAIEDFIMDEEDYDDEDFDDDFDDEDDEDWSKFWVEDGKCVFPEGVTKIADQAFSEERSIEHVEIPESVEVIGEGAFSFCRNLKTVRISGPLKKIKAEAFLNCRRLISINCNTTKLCIVLI